MKGLYIQTYGCQMNVSDSERMRALLAPLGFETVSEPDKADLVLINTCSIRDKAENKMSSFAYDIKAMKKRNPSLVLGVTGCVAQQEKEAIQRDLPFVDIVMGPDNIDELPWILEELNRQPGQAILRTEFDGSADPLAARVWRTQTKIVNPGPSVFVSVMKGCDHFCSYCIVPYTRGREKSRPIADIVEDVRELTRQGVREVTFLGQNINTYGKRAGESLHELFHRVHDIEGLQRIRFTTSHPGDLRDELVRCFEDLPKLTSYFHLPVQSGSNRVLRDMRRFYTREQYLDRVRALRQARPDIAFSTDFIVGFPGETEEDLELSISLAREVRFDNAYSFVYSKRPGTSAAVRPDTTPDKVKIERLMRLQTELRRTSRELHEAELGQVREILVEGPSRRDPSRMTGRTSQNVPVHTPSGGPFVVGAMVKVRVVEATLTHLRGEALEEAFDKASNETSIASSDAPITRSSSTAESLRSPSHATL